jgi:hypothetical protein
MSLHFLRRVFRFVFGLAAASAASAADADNIEWISISLPASGQTNSMLQFNATVKNTGTTTWDGNCYLELKDATSGTHLDYPSVAGVAPGQTVSRMFLLYLPPGTGPRTYSFKGLRHNVGYFGSAQTRTINVVAGPVNDGVRLAGTPVDGRYVLNPEALPLPVINSSDSLTPDYRLRAKIIDGTHYGFHAATTWNNKGLPLDHAPPAGDYPIASLYWLKYESQGGTLLEVGPERFVAVSVPGSVVALSTYCFGQLQPPQISISGTLEGTYWLSAKFRNAWGSEWDTTPRPFNAPVNSHNQNATLVNLPPPGDYTVELSYRRFDAAGNVVVTSPTTYQSAVVYSGGGVVLSTSGETTIDWGHNENGDWEQQFHHGEHQFQVPIPGNLQVTISALFSATTELLRRNSNNEDDPVMNWGGGASESIAVTPGTYILRVHGGPGPYFATAIVTTTLAPPQFNASTPATAAGTFGAEFSGYIATASGGGDMTYALLNPPPGLGIVSQGGLGIVTGRPTATGLFSATLTATNGIDTVAKAVVFNIARAVPRAEFPPVIVGSSQPIPLTQAMFNAAKFLRPSGTPETVLAPTGTLAFTAVRKLAPFTSYVPFTPSSLSPGLSSSIGELLVTASYPGDSNYLPATVTTTFWNSYLAPPVAHLAEQVTATRFLASWSQVPGATGYRLDVARDAAFTNLVLNSHSPVYVFNGQSSIATSHTVTGLTPSTDYWYRVRAVTSAGTSANSSVISVRTSTATSGAASIWFDKPVDVRVNNVWTKVYDGLRDEIIPAGGAHGLTYYVLDYRYTGGTVTFYDYDFPTNDWWYPRNVGFDFNGDGTSDVERPAFTPLWQSGITFSYTGEIYQRIGVEFDPEVGYDYEVCYSTNDIISPESLSVVNGGSHIYAENANRMIFALFNEFTIAELNRGSLYLVRYAKPIGSVSVGTVSIPVGATPGSGGTVTVHFPSNGKVIISIKDIVNVLLKAGSKVVVDVLDALGIPISSTSSVTVGGDLDIGITTSGQLRIGLKLDDSTTVWFNLIVQPPPKIEFVRGDQILSFARIGHWGADRSDGGVDGYESGNFGGIIKGQAPNDFIDRDPDRFYLRVTDSAKNTDATTKQNIIVQLSTRFAIGTVDDAPTAITLEETDVDTGIFLSESQLLVSENIPTASDDGMLVYSKFATSITDLVDDEEPNDRTHRAAVDGVVRAEYPSGSTTSSAVLPVSDQLKVLHVVVNTFNEPWQDTNGNGVYDAGEPFIDISAGATTFSTTGTRGLIWSETEINLMMTGLRATLAQTRIKVVENARIVREPELNLFAQIGNATVPEGTIGYFNAFDDLVTGATVSRDHAVIQARFRSEQLWNDSDDDDVVDIYFVAPIKKGPSTAYATQYRPGFVADQGLLPRLINQVFVGLDAAKDNCPTVLAHELLHQLTNRPDIPAPAHIVFPSDSFGRNEGSSELWKRRIQEATTIQARTLRGSLTEPGNKLLRNP